LIRDLDNPLATRFEVRSPNPHTNTYLALAAIYQGMMDGINHVIKENRQSSDLEREFSKAADESGRYLETGRMYRSEEDLFEAYDEKERNTLFGAPPATVWETIELLRNQAEKTWFLMEENIFDSRIIHSYSMAMLNQWMMELKDRILPENMEIIRSLSLIKDSEVNTLDKERTVEILELKKELMKDQPDTSSLCTQLRQAIEKREYQKISTLQQLIEEKMEKLHKLYAVYHRNFF